MNYAYQYFKIIANRVEHPISREDGYCECHHIIPKSEGGRDTKDNLVNLTAREHYIAHLLLAKIYNDKSMWGAAFLMCHRTVRHTRKYRISSRIYQKVKLNLSDKLKEFRTGKPPANKGKPSPFRGIKRTKEVCMKISERKRGVVFSEAHRKKLSESHKGKKMSLKARGNMSKAQKGHIGYCKGCTGYWKGKSRSEETKRKISEALRGYTGARKGKTLPRELRSKLSAIHKARGTKPPLQKGKHWFNNGEVSVLDYKCPEGFVKGMLRKCRTT